MVCGIFPPFNSTTLFWQIRSGGFAHVRYFFPWTHLTVAPVAKHVFSSSQPRNLVVRQRNSCVAIQLVTSLRPRIKLFGHTVKKDATLSKHCLFFLSNLPKKRRPNKKNHFLSFNAVHFRRKVLRRLHNTILSFWETGIAFTAQKRNLVFSPAFFPFPPLYLFVFFASIKTCFGGGGLFHSGPARVGERAYFVAQSLIKKPWFPV